MDSKDLNRDILETEKEHDMEDKKAKLKEIPLK
jgi:hypothetical protein